MDERETEAVVYQVRIELEGACKLRPAFGRTMQPHDDRPSWAPLMDLNMLAVLPGRERTAREYRDLVGHAGLCLDCITPTATRFSLIEASPR